MPIKLPIGPQHPALKEPEFFNFTVEGEVVVDCDVRIGYAHRGIEKACEERTYIQDLYLVERICGICSHSHTTPFAQGVEELLGVTVPKRGLYIRTLIGELERIHSHLLWLGVAGHEAGFDTLFMYTWRDRETVQDVLELISGNRVHYAMNTIGGVRRDVPKETITKALEMVAYLEKRTGYYLKLATAEPTFIARVKNVGPLPKQLALDLCAVGPMARASGVARDVRKDDPYAAYAEMPFEVITFDSCDLLARTLVRVYELMESYKIANYILKNLPDGDIRVKVPRKVPPNEVVSRYEAPRGENVHFIKSNGTEKPDRVKIRAPTLGNIPALMHTLKGGFIADIPMSLAAIDPCFCCMDRMVRLVDYHNRGETVMTWQELQAYAAQWYKKRSG
jgi:NADH-quinone oxidoreductase subunit D